MRRLFLFSVAAIGACAFSGLAQARAGLLLDITGGNGSRAAGTSVTVGWAFTVNSPVEIGGLGVFDVGANGLEAPSLVRLWTGSEVLLASTTVTNGSRVVSSTSALGDWLFNDISPIMLTPGTYVVGADLSPTSLTVTSAVATTDPAITFDGSRISAGGTPGFPDFTFGDEDSIFGPNLSSVPEPSTGVLCTTGLLAALGLFAACRRVQF